MLSYYTILCRLATLLAEQLCCIVDALSALPVSISVADYISLFVAHGCIWFLSSSISVACVLFVTLQPAGNVVHMHV